MTAPDDLLKRSKFALDLHTRDPHDVAQELVAALESDRALLRRIVEAWDGPWGAGMSHVSRIIAEARARVGPMTIHYIHPLEMQPEDTTWCGRDPSDPERVTTDHEKATCHTCRRVIEARARVGEK